MVEVTGAGTQDPVPARSEVGAERDFGGGRDETLHASQRGRRMMDRPGRALMRRSESTRETGVPGGSDHGEADGEAD